MKRPTMFDKLARKLEISCNLGVLYRHGPLGFIIGVFGILVHILHTSCIKENIYVTWEIEIFFMFIKVLNSHSNL